MHSDKSTALCHLSAAGTERGQTRDRALGSLTASAGPEWVCVRFPAQQADVWRAAREPVILPCPPPLKRLTWTPRPCVGRALATGSPSVCGEFPLVLRYSAGYSSSLLKWAAFAHSGQGLSWVPALTTRTDFTTARDCSPRNSYVET